METTKKAHKEYFFVVLFIHHICLIIDIPRKSEVKLLRAGFVVFIHVFSVARSTRQIQSRQIHGREKHCEITWNLNNKGKQTRKYETEVNVQIDVMCKFLQMIYLERESPANKRACTEVCSHLCKIYV